MYNLNPEFKENKSRAFKKRQFEVILPKVESDLKAKSVSRAPFKTSDCYS